MGEIEPMTIKAVLPTSYTIGERTHGGTGPLQPASCINLNYGGPFGDQSLSSGHYVYTSSFEAQVGGMVWEGIGLKRWLIASWALFPKTSSWKK